MAWSNSGFWARYRVGLLALSLLGCEGLVLDADGPYGRTDDNAVAADSDASAGPADGPGQSGGSRPSAPGQPVGGEDPASSEGEGGGAPYQDASTVVPGPSPDAGAGASPGPGVADAGGPVPPAADPIAESLARGAGIYPARCAGCHGNDGQGGRTRVPLTEDTPFESLAKRIDDTMPKGNAGACDRTCAEDLARYILATFVN